MLLPCLCANLRINKSAEHDRLYAFGKFHNLVVDCGEVYAEVEVVVTVLKHSHVKTDFVGPCAHLSGVGHQVLVTCRTCGGHRENLVGYILVGYGVFKANTVVDARQVE